MKKNFKEHLEDIRAFVFDVDGVFTNGEVLITTKGEFLRKFNMKDGLAVVRAVEKNYPIAIISAGRGEQVEARMKMLGITHIYMQQHNKLEKLNEFAEEIGIPLSQITYMGDDYPDLESIKAVRLGVAPADAADDIKAAAAYTSAFNGGQGCVRDIIEQVLRARGDWFNQLSEEEVK